MGAAISNVYADVHASTRSAQTAASTVMGHETPGSNQATGTVHQQGNAAQSVLPPTDCRACRGAQQMIDTFKHLMSSGKAHHNTAADSHTTQQSQVARFTPPPLPTHTPASAIAAAASITAAAAASKASTQQQQPGTEQQQQQQSIQAAAAAAAARTAASKANLPCPPETAELGNATWKFLHTMAAYYPEEPTGPQRSLMRSMIEGLAEFYPCQICAEHLRVQIQDSPPDVSSGSALSLWMCKIHNEVNQMLGKPKFDCSRVMERWRDGPADGSCG